MPAGNRRRRRRTGSGTPPGWWVIAWAAEVGDGRTHGAPASLSPWMEQGAACWDGMGLATGGGEGGRGWNWPMGRQDALSPKRRRRRASPLGRSVSWLRLLPPFPSDPIDRPSPSRRTWWMPRRRGGGPPHWAKLFFTNMILHRGKRKKKRKKWHPSYAFIKCLHFGEKTIIGESVIRAHVANSKMQN